MHTQFPCTRPRLPSKQFYTIQFTLLYLEESLDECLALLVAGTTLSQCILNVFVAITYQYSTRFASNKCQKMVNLIVLSVSLAELGYTVYFVHDSRLIIIDHRILIGCNTFLQATRASSCDVTAIKK